MLNKDIRKPTLLQGNFNVLTYCDELKHPYEHVYKHNISRFLKPALSTRFLASDWSSSFYVFAHKLLIGLSSNLVDHGIPKARLTFKPAFLHWHRSLTSDCSNNFGAFANCSPEWPGQLNELVMELS